MERPVERTEEDREHPAETDQEIWEEARDRLKIAQDAETDNRKRGKAAMLFREGEQWPQDLHTTASEDSIELTINLTDVAVRRVVNNIKQQRPRGKCHPVGDGADVEIADIINGIGRHVETRSEASVAYDHAAERAVDAGVGYFRMVAEYVDERSFQKDLRILPIRNIFTVYMDPGAIMPSGADQDWCIISVKMKRQEYRRRYKNAKNVNWEDAGRDELRLDWEGKEEVRLAEYFRVREKAEKLYLIRDSHGNEFTRFQSELMRGRFNIDEFSAKLVTNGMTIEGERDSMKRQVEWFRLNGLVVVEKQILPGQYIPVFRVEGNAVDIDGRIRRRGMVESLMDPARMVNYGEVAKIKRLGLAPKAPWVAAEGQLDGHPEWDDANTKAYSTLTYKPVVIETSSGPMMPPPPARQAPAQIEAGFSEFVNGMRSNLLAVAGMQNEPGQDVQGIVVSGQAQKRRQWLSDQAHFQYYDNLTLAIAQCWRVMVEWIPHYFNDDRMQRIIGDDSTPKMVNINQQTEEDGIAKVKNDLSIGRYDVVMDTGPGFETKREEGAQNLLDIIKTPLGEIVAKQGADLVFRSIDHPYMQELADRLMASNPEGMQKVLDGMPERAKNIVQSLMAQIQQMQKQMQDMGMQLKSKTDIEQGWMAVEREKNHLNAEAKTHDVATRAVTAQNVEEIRAIASLMVKHLDTAQLEREIQSRDEQQMVAGAQANASIGQQAAQQQQPQPVQPQ